MHHFGERCCRCHRLARIDQSGELPRQIHVHHMIQTCHVVGIGQKTVARVIGQFRGFGFDVGALAQDRRCALPVWRVLDDFDIFVGTGNGPGFFAARPGKVLEGVQAAGLVQGAHHVFGNFPGVEGARPFFCDAPQHFGLPGGTEDVTDLGRLAVDEKLVAGGPLQVMGVVFPVEGDPGRDRNAVFGVADRRRKQPVQPEGPDRVGEMCEGGNRRRNGDGMRCKDRNGGFTCCTQLRGVLRRRGTARSVQGKDFVAAALGPEHEAVAADAGHRRLADTEQDGAGDRGVHGVAAALQGLDGGFRSQRMRCRAHPVRGEDGGPSGKMKIAHGAPLSS